MVLARIYIYAKMNFVTLRCLYLRNWNETIRIEIHLDKYYFTMEQTESISSRYEFIYKLALCVKCQKRNNLSTANTIESNTQHNGNYLSNNTQIMWFIVTVIVMIPNTNLFNAHNLVFVSCLSTTECEYPQPNTNIT